MKALVTGAAGLVGRATIDVFRDRGWAVVCVSRIPSGLGADEITLDLAEALLPPEALVDVDVVVHLAAIPGPGVVSDPDLFRNNVCSTFNVLHAAAQAGVARSVVASSISIYGLVYANSDIEPSEIPLSETSQLRIADAYALSKETDEATARMISRRYGMSIASLRFPNISSEQFVIERAAAVRRDASVAHRELWAYLTTEDAGLAIFKAAVADFDGTIVANCVSPNSLLGADFARVGRGFYPSAADAQTGYTTSEAQRVFGFEGRRIPL
jgi:nucleoside-diphosphate-sugar epimerase